MKCHTSEQWMLLEQTGELSPRRARRMEQHLAECTACREWHAALRVVETCTAKGMPHGDPSATTLATIKRTARQHIDRPGYRHMPAPWLRPAYGLAAVAALCLVLIGSHWISPTPAGAGGEVQLSMILLMLTEETNSEGNEGSPTLPGDAPVSLESLGQDLLVLQGWDEDYGEGELNAPSEALPATTPLTRSTPALPAIECV